MSAIANKIVEKYNLSSEMKKRKNKTINIATSKQTPEKSEVETIREIAHRILQDNFSASDVKAKTCALANSAPNANASSSRLFRLQRELRSLNASPEVIEATKFSDITKEANEIQKDQQIKAEVKRIDYPDHFTLESVKKRLDKYDISIPPDLQALADVMIMLCIRPAELTSLHITDAGVTEQWFSSTISTVKSLSSLDDSESESDPDPDEDEDVVSLVEQVPEVLKIDFFLLTLDGIK
ncbi:hypothetical protein C2G38_2163313 [Gigaspora rosea]|uniref:Uncharacterized protein n=1 Tax=Gigaspora rosea TaxID=44941 RepID=A0A397VX02_9GLOM|nr:hypothetical protein C2G38_2163313 [Gigaspora rosea]